MQPIRLTLSVLIFCSIALAVPCYVIAQGGGGTLQCIPKPDMLDGQKVFRLASKLAQYPGGEVAMMQFIQTNFKHSAGKNQTQKSILVTFVVDTLGKVREVCIEKKRSSNLDEHSMKEIREVFESMPRWDPAVTNGRKTYMRLVMPVQLILD
jgi:protein TonB